jgi:predicted ribonuclease YlaK
MASSKANIESRLETLDNIKRLSKDIGYLRRQVVHLVDTVRRATGMAVEDGADIVHNREFSKTV